MIKFYDILKENENIPVTIVLGGINGTTSVKKAWPSDVPQPIFLPWNADLSTYNINKIIGFSKGGKQVWDYIDNPDIEFVGLIDPVTRGIKTSLPSHVKMMSNHHNWTCPTCGRIKKELKQMEKNNVSEKNRF